MMQREWMKEEDETIYLCTSDWWLLCVRYLNCSSKWMPDCPKLITRTVKAQYGWKE